MTDHERTGWRDQEISIRHRLYGHNAPMVDCDTTYMGSFWVEYDLAEPVAMCEFKHFKSEWTMARRDSNLKVLEKVALRARLPFWVALYWPDVWTFRVYPLNDRAAAWFAWEDVVTEREYVRRLYAIRGRSAPILGGLFDLISPDAVVGAR